MNSVYASLGATIFDVMSRLAAEKGAINLGQGFPESDGPRDILEAAARATLDGPNQYPPMRGLPDLRLAVAAHYNEHHGLDLDWSREVTITSGATEAIAAALLAFIEPGDEVVLFEPLYDAYLPMVRRAGGVPRIVRLQPPHWRFERETVAAAFSDKTRVVVINTPLNPSASVMSRAEIELVAELCRAHNAICVSDEVWEHLLFDGAEHVSMLSALRDRTLKIGSAGKMFSLTAWKVGFACAAPELTELFTKAHQFLTFTTPPNLQRGVAHGLGKDRSYFEDMRAGFQRSRDRLKAALEGEGFATLPARGAYFLSIDLAASGIALSEADFARHAIDHGVATIPISAFYAAPGAPALVRLCFAKSDATLDRGAEALIKAKRALA
ncbi:aminotransferase [Candidatus Viadribacter manganicus]|uniref:Aminotransferase n=1 Tax=Candidatus Viadribacter manganicus TaxID=1759059 RepID=A0A1B1AIB6_9PROT|nr:aminotransferase [Candidatus Viadribacter manganicus]ANP46309.1 aminotransferase [Candidatus Viadribacter manganicus]